MKKIKLLVSTMLLSTILSISAFAGIRTNVWYDGNVYEYHVFYVKDDGTYAKNEWIQDTDGNFYWVDEVNSIATNWGIALDGRLYNSYGKLIPMDDKKFATIEDCKKLKQGMTYEEVVAILGMEHEMLYCDTLLVDEETGELAFYLDLTWYAQDNEHSIEVNFINNLLSDTYFVPRQGNSDYEL